MVQLTVHETICDETIRRRLGEMLLKPWQEKMWCIPKVDAEFVARMEDVLALYTEPPRDAPTAAAAIAEVRAARTLATAPSAAAAAARAEIDAWLLAHAWARQ